MKLSKEIIEEITKLLQNGNYAIDAVNYLGISEVVFYDWKKKGKEVFRKLRAKEIKKEELTLYQRLLIKFVKSIKKARATGKIRHAQNIQKVAFGTESKYDEDGNLIQKGSAPEWTASAWYLERTDHKKWGRKDYQKIDANIKSKNVNHNIDYSALTEEEAKELFKQKQEEMKSDK